LDLKRYFLKGPRSVASTPPTLFWEVELRGRTVKTRSGKFANRGRSGTKSFASPEDARAYVDKLIRDKLKGGYKDQTPASWLAETSKKAKASALKKKPARRARTFQWPFLFFGAGFGTSERSLECYVCFAKAPTRAQQADITETLPKPLARFARFDGVLLHFGSDDDLEASVKAAYGKGIGDPTPREWQLFCDDFERSVKALHEGHPLIAVVKPDSGEYGKKLSQWHRDSVSSAERLAEHLNASVKKPKASYAAFTQNVAEDVLESDDAANALSDAARGAWRTWLDRVKGLGPTTLRQQLRERRHWLA
jgi:predicted DNA-binding WGR domain protein